MNAPTTAARPEPQIEMHSSIPGRIRLRAPRSHRSPEDLHTIKSHLAESTGVASVETNHRTGSILLATEPENHEEVEAGILNDVDEIGNVLSFGMGGEDVDGIADQLAARISDLNKRLYQATGENYHLGTFVPAGVAGLGAWQTLRTGLGLELIPGPILLWLAYDLYQTFGSAAREETGAI